MTDIKKSLCHKIIFDSDGYKLTGYLHLPGTQTPPVVIGSHGLASDCSSPKQIALAEKCCQNGIAFFRFHHRGCGESEGDFVEVTSLKTRSNDLKHAIQLMINHKSTGNKIGLFGSSMGGTSCISVYPLFNIDVIVTFAAPVSSDTLTKAPEKEDGDHILTAEFYEKHLQFDVSRNLSEINNILVFHGDNDDIVEKTNAETIINAAKPPKKTVIQDGGDHRMSDKFHQETFLKETVTWFKSGFDI